MIYQHMYSTKIQEFGCIRHRDYAFIGASPDGINVDPKSERYGRMLEIKNPVNRELTGVPKPEYCVQMQGQLEVCDLDDCDFLETVFKEYDSEEAFYKHSRSDRDHKVSGTETDCKVSSTETDRNDSQIESDIPEYRGVILYFVQRVSMGDISSLTGAIDTPHYEYMPLDVPITKDAVDTWIAETRLRLRRDWTLYLTS
jgi:hypothetical protein